jgi:hypothetical protein
LTIAIEKLLFTAYLGGLSDRDDETKASYHGEAIMARRRRGAAQWAALIDEWEPSGLGLPEFCRRRGLNRGTMQGWV